MSSLREQAVQAAVTALNTDTPAGVPQTERARTLALDAANLPTIIAYAVKDEAGDVGGRKGPIVARKLRLHFECWAVETEELSADAAVDPLICWVVKALTDSTLGGLLNGLREAETTLVLDREDRAVCYATVVMVADYQCKSGDLEQRH